MKKTLLITIVIIFGILTCANYVFTFSNGPGEGYTSSPGDNDCTGCHNSYSAVIQSPFVTITGITTYSDSQTYSITVTLTPQADPVRNGFSIIAVDSTDTYQGNLIVTDAVNTQLVSGGGRENIQQTTAGRALTSWTFDWKAPASDTGSIIFYVSLVDGNGGGSGGDTVYNSSLTVPYNTPVALNENVKDAIDCKVFPNPASDILYVNYELIQNASVEITLSDIQGKTIASFSEQKHIFDISNYVSGIYFFNIKVDNKEITRKIYIQK